MASPQMIGPQVAGRQMTCTLMPDATIEGIDAAETVRFLQRLSSFISVGQNAANLQDAATLIEALSYRASEAERLIVEQEQKAATMADTCKAYESMLDRAQTEIIKLKDRLDQQAANAAAERTAFAAESSRLSDSIDRAEADLAVAVAELDELRSRLVTADGSVSVPVETLAALRVQFEVLSEQFIRNGDLISRVMSEIGRCAIDQIISDNLPVPEVSDLVFPKQYGSTRFA
jgi:DNA repair exonuclease SbcCD ATPase subunit